MNTLISSVLPPKDSRGINIVDLMMWLVIAALLLATAIQGIGYYQKAAYLNNMISDANGAASLVMSTAATGNGIIDQATVDTGLSQTKWTGAVEGIAQSSTGSVPYIRVSHPQVTGSDVVYLFQACGDLKIGANVVPKAGVVTSGCSISASPWTVNGDFTMELSGGLTLTRHIKGGDWISAATSKDGTYMVAGQYLGNMRTSTDGGNTWVERTNIGFNISMSAAISDDGQKMASIDANTVYTSADGGATWRKSLTLATGMWRGVASSSDGNRLVAANNGGQIYTSSDAGANWTKQAGSPVGGWYSIASSGDGKTILAGQYGGGLYISKDYGVTWAKQSLGIAGPTSWLGVSISNNGSVMTSGNWESGGIYVSLDGGATWDKRTAAGDFKWRDVVISGDGKRIVAGERTGGSSYVHTSSDGGLTWSIQSKAGTGSWDDLALSEDGKKLLISTGGVGALYTGAFTP